MASTWIVAPNAPAGWQVVRSAAPRRHDAATPTLHLCLSSRQPQSVGAAPIGFSRSRRTLATPGVVKLSRREWTELPCTANSARKIISAAAVIVERYNCGMFSTEQSSISGCELETKRVRPMRLWHSFFPLSDSFLFLFSFKSKLHHLPVVSLHSYQYLIIIWVLFIRIFVVFKKKYQGAFFWSFE